jgi:uncharacterized membrane protein YqjE
MRAGRTADWYPLSKYNMNEPPPTSSPLMNFGVGQIVSAVKILAEALMHRGELAAFELAEARAHAIVTVLVGIAGFVLTLLGGMTITFTLAASVWDRPDRSLILGLVSMGYLVAAGLLFGFAVYRLLAWHPLEETRRQMRDDRSCIQSILTPLLDH